ncbi:MAG: helix-turn-helix domain-containing protein [Clostridia bacterium]|nr:helix-turn-helix domain-containing protein [Clostridia bacterium]
MGNIKENYDLMFTAYPDIVNIVQLKEMLGIGVNLAYRLVRNQTIPSLKVGREYKIPKRNIIYYLTNQN